MATSFECDPVVAQQVSGQIGTVRADLAGAGASVQSGSTGSPGVDGALQEFLADSTDSRQNLDQLLQRAAGLLAGLAQGTTATDRSLAGALTPGGTPAGGAR